jgi:oligopeptide/dipeptide ABC transporter ATP-binding protein
MGANGSGPTRPLLDVRDLHTHFGARRPISGRLLRRPQPTVRAVDGVTLSVGHGEVVGLVGESGSGKTTLGQTILRLTPATSGQAIFDGVDVLSMGRAEFRRQRRRMQMIFQEPHGSLSPRLTVGYSLTEPYRINRTPAKERYSVEQLLAMVELGPEHASKYPHELSGGQARRVGIARALTLHPELIIADEPTAGLDVSAAASVVNLMKELNRRLGISYLLITHNLNLVGHIADRIAVMYLGQLVEVGATEAIFESPSHPYTRALLSAVSEPDPSSRAAKHKLLLPGEIPSPKNPPAGCRFHTRCAFAENRCQTQVPEFEPIDGGHTVACHYWRKVTVDVAKAGAPQ